jgi:hypothetical protein
MRPVFGIALVVGFVALVAWVIAAALDRDPEERVGLRGRRVVGGLVAFGMGGLSAAYGGLAEWVAVVAAVGAGALVAWYVGRF